MATEAQIMELRRLVDDTVTPVEYTDLELNGRIDLADGALGVVAHAVWIEKAAKYARLVNVSESGSSRSLSDLHRNALAMAERFAVPVVPTRRTGTRRIERA